MSKVKKLLNNSEAKILNDIENMDNRNSFRVFPQIPLNYIIDRKNIDPKIINKKSFNDASFDFVITDVKSHPLFVIDFDGPYHHTDSSTILSDLRKMDICAQVNLPILKIDYQLYDTFSEDGIIDFIINRYLKWKDKKERYEDEYKQKVEYLQELGKTSDEIYDYMMVEEPEMNFNYDNYYPRVYEVTKKLYKEYNIIPQYLSINNDISKNTMYIQKGEAIANIFQGIATSVREYSLEGSIIKNGKKIIFKESFESEPIKMIWLYSYDIFDILYSEDIDLERFPAKGTYKNGIPGIQNYDLCSMLADYKCLIKIEEYASKMKEKGIIFLTEKTEDIEIYFNQYQRLKQS